MLVYVYDGSFEGLLTAVFEAYYRKQEPERLEQKSCLQYGLLEEYVYIETDETKFKRVYASIKDKISEEALEWVYHVYLSDDMQAGTFIYEYLKLGWRMGRSVNLHLSDDRVLRVYKIYQRVAFEVHRMMGFVRFKLAEGSIYYAPVSPDNNIIELLAPHFSERLADQKWILHDVKRGIAVLYNTRDWIITEFEHENVIRLDKSESDYQKLWKDFFNTIGISSRVNPKLQKQLMPQRYWKHLTEKN